MQDTLRGSIDHLLEGVQLMGPDWRYLYVNAAAAAHSQRPAADLVGQTLMECYPGIEQTDVFHALQRVMESRCAEGLTTEFAFPSGERRIFDVKINPVPLGVCVLSLDVTEREQKQAEVRRLELEVQRQRLQVFRATMTTVNDIVNNFLNSLQYVRLEAEEDRLSADMLVTFDALISETGEKLKRLGELQLVREKEMAIGTGIDLDAVRP